MEDKKIDNIKLRNLIQPILVRKSYLYRGIPPRTNINKAINTINLKAVFIIAELINLKLKIKVTLKKIISKNVKLRLYK